MVHHHVVESWHSFQQATSEATRIKELESLWNIASFMAAEKVMV